MKTFAVGMPEPARAGWPEHLPAGALRVVRRSGHYDQTVAFYRDLIGLQVLETVHDSYGLDGTILGLQGGTVHLEIVRLARATFPAHGLDQLVSCLPDTAAQQRIMARLAAEGVHPVAQIDYRGGQRRRYLCRPRRARSGVRVLDLRPAVILISAMPPVVGVGQDGK